MCKRVQVASGRAAEHRDEGVLGKLGDLAHGRDPGVVEPSRRHAADAPEPLHRERVQELELAVRRHQQQTVRLGHAACDLRQELRSRDPDRDRQPDALAYGLAEPRRDLERRAGEPAQAADVEERLVDRQAFHERRRVVEHPVHGLARLRVGGHARPHDDRARAEAKRAADAHRSLDAACLRLVARAEDDASADEHGPPAKLRPVALLDGSEERVHVCVEDRRVRQHEHMFAQSVL